MSETSQDERLRIARLELVNALAAVDDLPTVEARARVRVADAQARLDAASAELAHVLQVEIPAVRGRVDQLKTEIGALGAQV